MEIRQFITNLRNFIRKELPPEYGFEITPGMMMESDGFQIKFIKKLDDGYELIYGLKTAVIDIDTLKPIVKNSIENFIEYASNIRSSSKTTES